ncbi:MAG: hypothetical protein ACI8WM_003439 [Burkholderiaceae bacterium]
MSGTSASIASRIENETTSNLPALTFSSSK